MSPNDNYILTKKGTIMEENKETTVEVAKTETEKKPNKVIEWIKDHKTNIRDIGIGAAAMAGLAVLIHIGSQTDDDYYDDDWDSEESYDETESVES